MGLVYQMDVKCEVGLVVSVVAAMEETHPGCRASRQRARSALLAAAQPSL